MSKAEIARKAGDHLGNVQLSGIHKMLSLDEQDWVALLRDHFYEIHRGRGER